MRIRAITRTRCADDPWPLAASPALPIPPAGRASDRTAQALVEAAQQRPDPDGLVVCGRGNEPVPRIEGDRADGRRVTLETSHLSTGRRLVDDAGRVVDDRNHAPVI